jgi:hypothetical protein
LIFGFAQPALYAFFAGFSVAAGSAALVGAAARRAFFAGERNCGRSPLGRFSGAMCSASCSRITRGPTSSISPTSSVPSANGP